jgi:hypothetical protein
MGVGNYHTLYRNKYLSGQVNEIVNLKKGQFLIIENDAILTVQGELTLKGNNYILFKSNKKFTIQGRFIHENISPVFISSFDINNHGKGLIFETGPYANRLEYIYFKNIKTGLSLDFSISEEINIKNCCFSKCEIGVTAKNQSVKIQNCLLRETSDYTMHILRNFNIEKNVFYKSYGSLLFDNNGLIRDNYFINNFLALIPYRGDIVIINNEFVNNEIAIAVNSSDCIIQYNDFSDNEEDIELNRNYIQFPLYEYCDPDVKFNNFFNSVLVINTTGKHFLNGEAKGFGINKDLEVLNCFWNANNDYLIGQRIYDGNDIESLNYYIKYIPYDTEIIEACGIQ